MTNTFKVPIRNLFYLLSYANEMPDMIDSLNKVEDELINYDFLANHFNNEVERLLARGLVRNYVSQIEETSSISGRLLINDSLTLLMERKPLVVCEKDNFTVDILFNQVMKTTLEAIYRNHFINEKIRRKSYVLWEKLTHVSTIVLTKELFLRTVFYRHNQYYKRMFHIAHLLFELELLSHQSGDVELFQPNITEGDLNRIFEKFLFYFFQIEQKEYRVHGEHMQWQLEGNRTYLPRMETDVSLTHRLEKKKIIIDAKFYRNMFQINFDKRSFHSHNMYQMFTYLHHQPNDYELRGILIYPANEQVIHEKYMYNERVSFEIKSIDLGAQWNTIYDELVDILM